MSATEPDDELRALVAQEKAAMVDPGPARARLAGRLGPLFDALPVAAPAAPVPRPRLTLEGWRLTGALLGTLALGAAAGSLAYAVLRPARVETRYVDRLVERTTADPSANPPPPPAQATAAVTASASARPERERSAPPYAEASDEALARERLLLEKARSALARADADAALAAVDEHAKAFPRGQFAEAREAIAIQALAGAGRAGEARARAARFRRMYSGSMYRAVVDAAVSTLP